MNVLFTSTALAVTVATALLLGGCGQKGPLYLPSAQKSQVPASQSGGTTPASQSPAPTSRKPGSQTPNSQPDSGATPPSSPGSPQG